MDEIAKKIENAKKQPLTDENLNYIGDLYLRTGNKTTAIAYFYELAEKLHISQKDKKLALYKKIINISTSESKAYEKIIHIFSRMGLAAEEKKYITMLANLYQNKGELNKLDALYRRINEIDPEDNIAVNYFKKGKQNNFRSVHGDVIEKKNDSLPPGDQISDKGLPGNNYIDKKVTGRTIEHADELLDSHDGSIAEDRVNHADMFSKTRFILIFKNYLKYILLCFLLILLGFSIYLYKGKSEQQRKTLRTDNIVVQTSNFEIVIKKLTDTTGLENEISGNDRSKNYYSLSINAKTSCISDDFVSSPYASIVFIDNNGRKINTKEIQGADSFTRTIYKTNICGKNSGAVFIKVIFAHDKKIEYAQLSLEGLETDGPILIKWD